ncbi:hypothetical protein HAX54_001762, partial [Datura stramonium]|nr:hypothetical protein [Datura stramonium]
YYMTVTISSYQLGFAAKWAKERAQQIRRKISPTTKSCAQIHCELLQLNWHLWGLPISPARMRSQQKKRIDSRTKYKVTSTTSGNEGYQQE